MPVAALSLREAAEQSGASKSTIFRAIRSGRLSAGRDDDGNFAIDPAELFRVYPPKGSAPGAAERERKRSEGQGATDHDATSLQIRNAELAAEIRALRLLLEATQQREGDLKCERDRWAAQAERLALAGPNRRGWWQWRSG